MSRVTDQVEYLVDYLHVDSKHRTSHRTSTSVCFLSKIYLFQDITQSSTCTSQNTLYFILPQIYINVSLVSEVHVNECIKVTFK